MLKYIHGKRPHGGKEVLPGWVMDIHEGPISVYTCVFRNYYSQTTSALAAGENGYEEARELAEKEVYKIELSINKHPGDFLLAYCISKFSDILIDKEVISERSWALTGRHKKIIFDGENNNLLIQNKNTSDLQWMTNEVVHLIDLDRDAFLDRIRSIDQENT